ncbi:hypothetical protein Tco_0101606, partial [Tanacetum coccineum]
MFNLKGNIIATSESEYQPDCSKGDNACTSNPQEPINKRTKKIIETMNATTDEPSAMACNHMSDCNPFFKEKGSVHFSALYLKKEEKSSCFHFSRYDSHDVNDRVGKFIRSFVLRIIQMEKIKLFQSLSLLLLL